MCQLLGLNANTPTDINFSFAGFSRRAIEHADGFGIAFFEDRGLRLYVDTTSADTSPIAQLISRLPIRSCNVLAHIRKATQGPVTLRNTHPFQRELWGRYWAFAHNGDLNAFHPKLHSAFKPVGDTDSERAFCWMMQEIAKSHAQMPTTQALTATLQELAGYLSNYGTFNMLLSQGDALWVHATTSLHYVERSHPFTQVRLEDDDLSLDFSRVTHPTDRVCVIATTPLTSNEVWMPLQTGLVTCFEAGGISTRDA